MRLASLLAVSALCFACHKAASDKAAATASAAATATATSARTSAHKMGGPISADVPVVSLANLVKDPAAYKGKPFVTTGTVTAVCQEMGCWMEIKDDATEAHIKMAGETFFVPKTSAGHKARVQGALVDTAGGGDVECTQEASGQMGKQVAKLQLEATGVELD